MAYLSSGRKGYTYYGSDGDQRHSRGDFLILADDSHFVYPPDGAPMGTGATWTRGDLYACIRRVALRQCGHFMMGSARIGGQSVTLSGPYGNDSLPIDYSGLDESARARFVRIPEDMASDYWSDAKDSHVITERIGAYVRDAARVAADDRYASRSAARLLIGQRVRVRMGVDHGRTGRVIDPIHVNKGSRGVPMLEGEYKPMTAEDRAVILDEDGARAARTVILNRVHLEAI